MAVCEVNLGRTADLRDAAPAAGAKSRWQADGFDSALAAHPAGYGLEPFVELCVRDPAGVIRILRWET